MGRGVSDGERIKGRRRKREGRSEIRGGDNDREIRGSKQVR